MSYLLDTCVVSELVKKSPRRQVVNWIDAQEESTLYLSALTIGELEKGIVKLPASARKTRLTTWVRRDLTARFTGRVLSIDARVASHWGTITGASERRGLPLPVVDSLIAATALVNELQMVSRNTEDFARCGVVCLNLWEE
ncbi:MAG: type II toxin-antitoxin system VapC family toxin [Deltaproteobacteria bacterium]|nr:type II toxin-antitoxin system VapC family toxin [Deltaproteobacteria bacterium]